MERFIENPFLTGRRMYKTGDLARWLPGDVLEYVGRTDDQVKFHGYRVEMNEIRCALNRHPQVRDSVVVLTKDSYGHDVMVAYYVSRRELAAAELRSFMAESIIEETLPNIFVHLTKLPLTLNGKINYGALPDLNAAGIPCWLLKSYLVCMRSFVWSCRCARCSRSRPLKGWDEKSKRQ